MVVEDLILNVKEHKLLKKHKNSLEKRYGVSICVPNVDKTYSQNDVIFGSINGIQHSIESVKRFLSKNQKKSKSSEWKYPEGIILVTLSDSEDESSTELDDTICIANSANCTKSAIVPLSNPLDESVCVIESTVDPENSQNEMDSVNSIVDPENSQNEVNSIVSLSDSILIIDSPYSEKTPDICRDAPSKKQKLKNEMNSVDSVRSPNDSIVIIDSPCSEVTPEFCRSASNKKQNTKKRGNKHKVRNPPFLPFTSGVEDLNICEVSSTTEELILKQCDEFENSTVPLMMKKVEPAPDFIALYNDNSRERSSTKRKLSPVTVIEDIVLDNSKLEKSMPVVPRRLRPVVIDGSNVARTHGKVNSVFSSKGIKLCVDYFLNRGHADVTAFVPTFRRHANCRKFCPTTDQHILEELAKKQHVVFTPSRRVNGQNISSYDDRFAVQLAVKNGGVIVSNDNFRDLQSESESFKEVIEQRLLMYCFVGDEFMVPDDPLGRNGPRLNEYLSFPPEEK